MEKIIVLGAGGFGREIAAMLKTYFAEDYHVVGFVDDGAEVNTQVNTLSVLGGTDWLAQQENLSVVFGIGAPQIKRALYEQLKTNASLNFPNLIHPKARMHAPSFIEMGVGNVVTDNCVFTTNIKIGSFNLFNLNTTIGHDVVVENFCSIMPGVNISGGAHLKDEVYVGTGAKLIKATVLETRSVVGAGAVVHTDVPADKTFAGVPAREIIG